MTVRLLYTGFEPFDRASVNPTAHLVERLSSGGSLVEGAEIRAVLLPTAYGASRDRWCEEVEAFEPHVALAFGVNMSSEKVALERIAVNVDDSTGPDNADQIRQGDLIDESGPAAYFSTLPIREMVRALQDAGHAAAVSNHAGTYVCNHLFYGGRHWLEITGKSLPFGFIHVPPFPEQVIPFLHRRGMALDDLVEVARICGEVVVKSLEE